MPNAPSWSVFTPRSFLADGGRCAIVIPDGILYRTIQAYSTVRRRLLTEFAVSAVIRLPLGVFPAAADTRTNILIFQRGIEQPEKIRYYQVLPPAGKSMYSKTNPLPRAKLKPVKDWILKGIADEQSWEVSVGDVKQFRLGARHRLAGSW